MSIGFNLYTLKLIGPIVLITRLTNPISSLGKITIISPGDRTTLPNSYSISFLGSCKEVCEGTTRNKILLRFDKEDKKVAVPQGPEFISESIDGHRSGNFCKRN